jgi:hypothetical protein
LMHRWYFMQTVTRQLKPLLSVPALLLLVIIGSGISCSLSSEEISTDPSFTLRFSADTIFFDTIFTEIPSVTKRLRVYNDNNSAVSIAALAMADPNTPYTLTVNGIKGTAFEATRILANDSILILLEADIIDRDSLSPYVVEDRLVFNTNGNRQEVSVFSWGQDANYLKDSIIACNTTWVMGKPYVIYNNVLIDSLCTLNIAAGTRIFSHLGSTIFVKGSLKVNGTADERVLFMNDRFDGDYGQFPGQWSGILFLEGSKNNEIRYTDIRNAEVGIWLGTPDNDDIADLILSNSIIENMSEAAVLAFTADLEMTNNLLDNAGQFVFGALAGGNYLLKHNTIANYASGFFKSQPTFIVTDKLELSDGSVIQSPVNLELSNNIIWGISTEELELRNETGLAFDLIMKNNLLRSTDERFNGSGNILNQDPLFIEPSSFNYQLDSLSPAIDSGADINIIIDLQGVTRSIPPDIGAYEKQ